MKHENIERGARLELKPERAEAYGIAWLSPVVLVCGKEPRKGYSEPWIVCKDGKGGIGHYKASDFKGAAK